MNYSNPDFHEEGELQNWPPNNMKLFPDLGWLYPIPSKSTCVQAKRLIGYLPSTSDGGGLRKCHQTCFSYWRLSSLVEKIFLESQIHNLKEKAKIQHSGSCLTFCSYIQNKLVCSFPQWNVFTQASLPVYFTLQSVKHRTCISVICWCGDDALCLVCQLFPAF